MPKQVVFQDRESVKEKSEIMYIVHTNTMKFNTRAPKLIFSWLKLIEVSYIPLYKVSKNIDHYDKASYNFQFHEA